MLPTTLLNTTSRAVAAVQNQTHTFRNVLQLQSSSSPTAGSSKNGPGSSKSGGTSSGGSSRWNNAGSRWQSGFHGASRAVTQANLSTLHDTAEHAQTDESEEFPSRHVAVHFTSSPSSRKTRLRSSSVSLTGRSERAETLGVLRAVQLYARSQQAFVAIERPPPGSRRNSVSASTAATPERDTTRPPTPVTEFSRASSPTPSLEKPVLTTDLIRLQEARDSKDAGYVVEVVNNFLHTSTSPSVAEFEVAIDALSRTRQADQPPTVLLDTYKAMIHRGLLPSYSVYTSVLQTLLDREFEVVAVIQRIEARARTTGVYGKAPPSMDKELIEKYQAENNASSAVQVFQTLVSLGHGVALPASIYTDMLRLAAAHENVDVALMVWSALEQSALTPQPQMYQFMVQAYGSARDVDGAETVFVAFRSAVREGSIQWPAVDNAQVAATVSVWNVMIEAYMSSGFPERAVGLVEEMIQNSGSAPPITGAAPGTDVAPLAPFDPSQAAPGPASSTFSAIIQGFCASGNVKTALEWFDRLLSQQYRAGQPLLSTIAPTRPDMVAWRIMLDALAKENMPSEIVRLLVHHATYGLHKTDDVVLPLHQMLPVITCVMKSIESNIDSEQGDKALAKEYLDFLSSQLMTPVNRMNAANIVRVIAGYYLELNEEIPAIRLLHDFVASVEEIFSSRPSQQRPSLAALSTEVQALVDLVNHTMSFEDLSRLAVVAKAAEMEPDARLSSALIDAFLRDCNGGEGEEPSVVPAGNTVPLLLLHSVTNELVWRTGNLTQVLLTLHKTNPMFNFGRHDSISKHIVELLVEQNGIAHVQELSERLAQNFKTYFGRWLSLYGPAPPASPETVASDTSSIFSYTFDTQSSTSTSPNMPLQTLPTRYRIDKATSKTIQNQLKNHVRYESAPRTANVDAAVQTFTSGLAAGLMPAPEVIGSLIVALGRAGDATRAKHVYTMSHNLLSSMEDDKKAQTQAWFTLEDSMIIALAQAGDIDSAHVHRVRVLEQGGAPSADAYGGLILHVKDTTDDTSNALALYRESQDRNVSPNIYLYNNIISKLAKARKADLALELFQTMKTRNVSPTSVTYGALIGACARVGDVESAETLFAEMTQMRNFKPRVPPYNTMMQLFTTTKPNRERSLHYYSLMKEAGVRPTSYTYKLLMDTYIIDPIDMAQVEAIFEHVVNSAEIELITGHFATLINAHGCVLKDLDNATAVFDSIPRYGLQIDALAIEAMMNVLATHRRTDLIPEYIAKMTFAGVHMTAYVVNSIIKGHAAVGDLPAARDVFESLVDTPTGVAAFFNHAPHEPSTAVNVHPMEPVYREPSTWEAMVRAELGAGERERAIALLERLKTRQYPDAVFNRISGILVDH